MAGFGGHWRVVRRLTAYKAPAAEGPVIGRPGRGPEPTPKQALRPSWQGPNQVQPSPLQPDVLPASWLRNRVLGGWEEVEADASDCVDGYGGA